MRAVSVWITREWRKRTCGQARDNPLPAGCPWLDHTHSPRYPHCAAPPPQHAENACGATATDFFLKREKRPSSNRPRTCSHEVTDLTDRDRSGQIRPTSAAAILQAVTIAGMGGHVRRNAQSARPGCQSPPPGSPPAAGCRAGRKKPTIVGGHSVVCTKRYRNGPPAASRACSARMIGATFMKFGRAPAMMSISISIPFQ